MTTQEHIRELCNRIGETFHPERIILFGSHAYGTPTWDSDVDLLVVMPFEGSPRQQAHEIRRHVPTDLAMDLLVRTPEQIAQRLEMGDSFIRDVLERGKVVYGTHHA